jgi:hypothetical protein
MRSTRALIIGALLAIVLEAAGCTKHMGLGAGVGAAAGAGTGLATGTNPLTGAAVGAGVGALGAGAYDKLHH